MVNEIAQSYGGGEMPVATKELNPRLDQVVFSTPENVKYFLFDAGVKYENVLIDLSIPLPDIIWVLGTNDGDENLDFKVVLKLDGEIVIDQIKEDIVPNTQYAMAVIGVPTAAQLSPGAHTAEWTISARRSGTVDPLVEYFHDSTTYHAGTPELNLDMLYAALVSATAISYVFTSPETGKQDNLIIDLSKDLPSMLLMCVRNAGDENIDIHTLGKLDGKIFIDKVKTNVLNGCTDLQQEECWACHTGYMSAPDYIELRPGMHACEWQVSARRSGTEDAFTEYYHDSVKYYCYTAALDAIATEVVIVQDGIEKPWLTGTPTGFEESPVLITPNTETYFKFKLSNQGDEDIKMNVGHLVGDHYEAGFVVGGTVIDTIEKDVEIPAAGGTGEINTQSFIVPPGPPLSIGSFVVFRVRSLLVPKQSFSVTFEDSMESSYGNLVSFPVYDNRLMTEVFHDLIVQGSGFYVVWKLVNGEWVSVGGSDILEPGVGYAIPLSIHAEVEVTGTPYAITADALIASLQTGFNLVGVGIEPVDISATGYTATYYMPNGAKIEGITLLEPGKAYFIAVL